VRVTARTAALVLLLVLPAAACASSSEPASSRTGVVDRVIDGDTLALRSGDRVRLVQIDAPEAGEECYADAATVELRRLARPGTRVKLERDPGLDDVDRFDRLLRYVHVGERNVNLELVKRGAATPYFFGGDRGRYAAQLLGAVASARAAKRGMWGRCRVSWSPTRAVDTHPR
jgi:micrococcal nuclease